ncbi:MAG: tail fiber domain-containing protein, partial [Thiohalomonadaceae bacterium]
IKSAMIGTLDASKITSGTISADRISVTNLSAISANIAGWKIGVHLTAGSGSDFVALYGGTATSYLRAGAEDVSSAPFTVTKSGALKATSATIRGTLSAGSIVNNSTVNANSSSYLYGYHPSGWLGGVAISNYGVGEMLLSGVLRVGGINQTTGGTGGLNTFSGRIESYSDLTVWGTFTNPSDIHYKQNIIAPDKKSLINNIYSLSIKEFEMRATPERKRLGVIANSVIVDQPDLASYVVAPNDEGYLEVDYQTISNMSILAIQDLNERVKRIEEKLA